MSERALEKRNERIALGVCISCGERPQFWGRKCILCRPVRSNNPLPYGARRALKRYRDTEKRNQLKQSQSAAQREARELLACGQVSGRAAIALRLYTGLDDGKWRTYESIGRQMNITRERVRQLLLPAKLAMTLNAAAKGAWRSREASLKRQHECSQVPVNECLTRRGRILKTRDDDSYFYQECGVTNVILFGLSDRHKVLSIPEQRDLNQVLARAILLKPGSLTGAELRFLRTTAKLSPIEFAEYLAVSSHTIRIWEESRCVRGPNDLAARLVIAACSFDPCLWGELFERFKTNRKLRPEVREVALRWLAVEQRWTLLKSEETKCP
jgi:putative transcriptional regulator